MTADIHIQLGSENPPNTAQILRYGILTLPTEFVDQPIRCEGLRGTYLEIQRKSKKQFIIQTLLLLWLPHLPQWKVACGSDYLPVSACQRRCCLPALWVAGTRSLCKCSAWKCVALSLHITLKPSWLLILFGNPRFSLNKMRNNQWTRWSQNFSGQLSPQRRVKQREQEEMGASRDLPKYLKMILFSIFSNIGCLCDVARLDFLSQACLWAFLQGEGA